MLTKTRAVIITLVTAFSLAGALVPAVAEARPVEKSPRPGMMGCTLKLAGNFSISVDDEQYVEVRTASGKATVLRCKNGKWYEEQLQDSPPLTTQEIVSPLPVAGGAAG